MLCINVTFVCKVFFILNNYLSISAIFSIFRQMRVRDHVVVSLKKDGKPKFTLFRDISMLKNVKNM